MAEREPTLDPALVEKAMDAFCASESTWLKVCISNALSAVIPDIRAEERERAARYMETTLPHLSLQEYAAAIREASHD